MESFTRSGKNILCSLGNILLIPQASERCPVFFCYAGMLPNERFV